MGNEGFNWYADSNSIVFPTSHAIAVYSTEAGDVVIRQQSPFGEGDSLFGLPKANVLKLISALYRELDIDSEASADELFRSFVRANTKALKYISHWGDGHGGYLAQTICDELGVAGPIGKR